MLYKKIHRQYLRQWRIGRRFKIDSGLVYEVTREPFIDEGFQVWLASSKKGFNISTIFTPIDFLGNMYYTETKWLN